MISEIFFLSRLSQKSSEKMWLSLKIGFNTLEWEFSINRQCKAVLLILNGVYFKTVCSCRHSQTRKSVKQYWYFGRWTPACLLSV